MSGLKWQLRRRTAPTAPPPPGPAGPFATTYTVTNPGWLTAPIAAIQGQLPAWSAVSVDGLTAQLDVKNRWPDGSLRYGLATAKMTTTGPAPIIPAGLPRQYVVVALGGTNDLFLNADLGDDTAPVTYARLVTYCRHRQAAGWRVLVCTLLPSLGATFETRRSAINARLRLHFTEYADALVDLAADSRIGAPGAHLNTTYYQDGIHPTAAGAQIIADLVGAALLARLGSTAATVVCDGDSITLGQGLTTAKYVSTTGNDSTGTGTQVAPWRTLSFALTQLVAGDTLNVRGGTYPESLLIDSGHANGVNLTTGAITVQAYPGETVWGIPLSGATALDLRLKSYWIWSGININAIHLSGPASAAVEINAGDHIRFQNATITNAYWGGLSTSQSSGFGTYYELLNLLITNGGRVSGGDGAHGIYITAHSAATTGLSTHHLISQCEVSGFTGRTTDSGIDVYSAPAQADRLGGTTVDRCYLHGNSNGSFLANATTVPLVYTNNRVVRNTNAGIVLYARLAGAQIYHNTVHANGDRGIEVGTGGAVTGALIKNNSITSNVGRGVTVWNTDPTSAGTITFNDLNGNGNNTVDDQNSLSTIASNLTTAPGYVNAGADDYHLAGGSGNINAGTTLGSVTTDADGVTRPQGAAYDIGAYEFV